MTGVAVVTGAAGGIGSAVVDRLARDGYRVVAADRDVTGWGTPGADRSRAALVVPTDVTVEADVVALVEQAEALGPVELLVNAAGVLRGGTVLGSTLADWEAVLSVNATGTYLVSREVARVMVPRGRGAIVTVASNAAGVPRAGMAAYAASKAAASSLTRSLGLELAEHGIRCNVVSPGSTRTPMLADLVAGSAGATLDPATEARVVAGDPTTFRLGIPTGRVAEPDDVASAVAFLASDGARHITLHDLVVDGGATQR